MHWNVPGKYGPHGELLNEMITSNVQVLMVVESDQEVKVDQEASITDVKFTRQGKSCIELRSVGRSSNVSKESPMSVSAANALIEKSAREMQSTSSMVSGTSSDAASASSTWTVEIVEHVVSGFQPSAPHLKRVKTACERRKRKSCRRALVKFGKLVVLMTIEKPMDKGKVRGKVDASTIMLDFVDRSDEVVPTTGRVVKARIVHRVPKEQRDGAPETRGLSEVCRGNRLRRRQLKVS